MQPRSPQPPPADPGASPATPPASAADLLALIAAAVLALGLVLGRMTAGPATGGGVSPLLDLLLIGAFCIAARSASRVMLTPLNDLAHSLRRIAAGEAKVQLPKGRGSRDFASLRAGVVQLLRRVERQQQDVERANERLRAKNIELHAANEVLSQLSITDGLTKLHNHRHFQDLLQSEARRVQRSGEPLSLILLDLDDFKQLNDQHGHAAGDDVLAWVARVLNDHVRDTDMLARYGGEEFTVLCIDTDLNGALQLAEKIRLAVDRTVFGLADVLKPIPVSVSAGVAQFRGNPRSFFAAADQALYRAKALGKNCVIAESFDA